MIFLGGRLWIERYRKLRLGRNLGALVEDKPVEKKLIRQDGYFNGSLTII